MTIHLFFDFLSYGIGAFLTWGLSYQKNEIIANEDIRYAYYSIVIIGAVLGAIIIGSLNTLYSLNQADFIIGKSILGAIVGGVVFVEIFKKVMKIKGSTGAYFVPSLVVGIAIGRLGCFFSGLEDYTYGIETASIFGYNFGDGVFRHPVQLYESAVMALFFIYVGYIYFKDRAFFEKYIFYQFILLYATQRFIWEFLKPYETIFFGLNIFQFFCLGLIVYALYYFKKVNNEKL